jgi:hypothetical protein
MAATFGETLLRRCLAIDRHDIQSLEVFRQRALGPNGKDRFDLMVHIQTPCGKSLWTIIETKLHAPGDTSQLERYQAAIEKFCPFVTAHGQVDIRRTLQDRRFL